MESPVTADQKRQNTMAGRLRAALWFSYLCIAYCLLGLVDAYSKLEFNSPLSTLVAARHLWRTAAIQSVAAGALGIGLFRLARLRRRIAGNPHWRDTFWHLFLLYYGWGLLAVSAGGIFDAIEAFIYPGDSFFGWHNTWLAVSLDAVGAGLTGSGLLWFDRFKLRRDHRTRNGLCRHCGYDLRASQDRCPECGTTFIQATSVVRG